MRIGNVEIDSKLYLAPMAGVTDAAFRQICRELLRFIRLSLSEVFAALWQYISPQRVRHP